MRIPGRIKSWTYPPCGCHQRPHGPYFPGLQQNQELKALVARVKEEAPLYDFVSEDAIRHRVWMIGARSMVGAVEAAFAAIPGTYIADGHHRLPPL
mgnify:CR=1 FL=1